MKRKLRVLAPKVAKKYVSKKAKPIIKTMRSKSQTQRGPTAAVMPCKLLYSDTYTINPGALGATATQSFRCQSLHDPDLTGVGHQAMGYDQLYGFYERYQVWKLDFEIEFVSNDGSNIQGVGYRFSGVQTTDTNPIVNLENGLGEFSLLDVKGGSSRKSFKGTVTLCDIHGVSYKEYMSNDEYGAEFGSNPAKSSYLHVWADGNGTDTAGVIARVRLTYHTKLTGSKVQALS